MKRNTLFLFAVASLGLVFQAQQAFAQGNPYPVGPIWTLDSASNPTIPVGGYVDYTASFVAAASTTDLTFAFRNDPGYTALDDVSVYDNTASAAATVVNGGFETGDLTGWTYDNVYGAAYGGVVAGANCGGVGVGPNSGNYEWCDGADGSYDAIDQVIATTAGDSYTISFWLNSGDSTGAYPTSGNAQEFCTNGADAAGPSTGCNAVDVAVYAQGGIPVAGTPEPTTLLLFGTGLAGVGFFGRRRSK